jgi:hypothetical protein
MESKLIIALETYTDDGWYGRRSRYIYSGPEGLGFKNKTEANKYKSKLKKFVKGRLTSKTEIIGDVKVDLLDNFSTYIYCGSGPSYACTNIEVKSLAPLN